ncbi:MAG: hypothetical protein A3F69_05650 [Acidobacteria bacterium RIFCSPLOWO2_12_FULL_66_10]|nr:MAG: hypothetical protein A3F69_05650 [Acidobacteria bacterium RIFCSPLOWO2_12_FULL_66_10]
MVVPWLRALDLAIGIVDLVRRRKMKRQSQAQAALVDRGRETFDPSDTSIAGVVDAAVKQALSRDARRMELERERLDADRLRAERAAKMDAIRRAGDRELGRLRLLTAVAVASWIGTVLAALRLNSGASGARVAMGGAWMLLLAAIVLSFTAQARVADLLARSDEGGSVRPSAMRSMLGRLAIAFVIAGLAMAGLAILV